MLNSIWIAAGIWSVICRQFKSVKPFMAPVAGSKSFERPQWSGCYILAVITPGPWHWEEAFVSFWGGFVHVVYLVSEGRSLLASQEVPTATGRDPEAVGCCGRGRLWFQGPKWHSCCRTRKAPPVCTWLPRKATTMWFSICSPVDKWTSTAR